MPRRKPGTLLPLEIEILDVALSMLRSGHASFYGFGLAQTMREKSGSRSLTAHGTLYKVEPARGVRAAHLPLGGRGGG